MNRNDRVKMRKACTDFDRNVREAIYIFDYEVERMKEEEDEKLERLPSQLRDSSKGDQLDESTRQLSDVLENLESIVSTVDDIIDVFAIESKFIAPENTERPLISPGRKGKSFHALFPESLLNKLKTESARRGISMNEIVCRTLQNELESRAI